MKLVVGFVFVIFAFLSSSCGYNEDAIDYYEGKYEHDQLMTAAMGGGGHTIKTIWIE